jgi:hypothetical protein
MTHVLQEIYIDKKYFWYTLRSDSKESKTKEEEKRRWKIKGAVQRDKNNIKMVQLDICLIAVRALFDKFI